MLFIFFADEKYGLHFSVWQSLPPPVCPYILLDQGLSKQPPRTAKIGALTTGQWLISVWLVPAVHQASGYRSYKDVTGFLSLLLILLALLAFLIKHWTVNHTIAEDENGPTRGCKPQRNTVSLSNRKKSQACTHLAYIA